MVWTAEVLMAGALTVEKPSDAYRGRRHRAIPTAISDEPYLVGDVTTLAGTGVRVQA